MTGIINVYKEKGYTSFDVVAIVRRLCKVKKVGHTGTLDPQAEGVLPVCVGRAATRLAGIITDGGKSYQAELILGMTTDTGDHTGQVLTRSESIPPIQDILEAAKSFEGGYMQVPPMYSALKINGQRLYKLARAGQTVERAPRPVEISRINLLEGSGNRIWIEVDCGKGTYIRSLCEDIGAKLNCGGCMGDLIRTKSGPFTVESALRLSELESLIEEERFDSFLLPPEVVTYG